MNLDKLKPGDFRRLYGEIPETYKERVRRTLSGLPSQTRKVRFAKRRLALVLAALFLLICGTVYAAARWGLVDFFDLYGGMPPSAAKIVSQVAIEYDAGEAVVALREAVADGFSYHLTAEVRPKAPEEIRLLPPMLDGSMEDEVAMAAGRRLAAASIYVEGADPDGDQGIDWKTEDDGTLVYVISGELATQADAVQLSLLLVLTDYGVTGDADNAPRVRETFSFTLPVSQGSQARRVEIGKEVVGAGVLLEYVDFTTTPLATYYAVACSLAPDALDWQRADFQEGWFSLSFVDENGDWTYGSPSGGGGYAERLDSSHALMHGTLRPLDPLPDTMYVYCKSLGDVPVSNGLYGITAFEVN